MFTSIGYASVSETLDIHGNSYLQPSNTRNGITIVTKDSPTDSSNTFNAYDVLNPGEHSNR